MKWKLNQYLAKHQISPHQLMVATGLSVNTVYPIARGEAKRISLETLDRLLFALRELTQEPVDIGDLLSYEETPTPDKTPSWKDLVGQFDDPDSPGDVSARVDDYLAEATEQDYRDSTRTAQ